MAERLALLPLAVLIVISAGITFVGLGEALGSWLLKRFGGEKARLGVRKPPVDVSQRLADLLARRPDLAGLGVTYVLEAVCV